MFHKLKKLLLSRVKAYFATELEEAREQVRLALHHVDQERFHNAGWVSPNSLHKLDVAVKRRNKIEARLKAIS